MNTHSKKQKTRKSTCITDDSFIPNGNMSNRMLRAVNHNFEFYSKYSRCSIHRWATDRKVLLCNDVCFYSTCNICICIACHKLLHDKKDLLG